MDTKKLAKEITDLAIQFISPYKFHDGDFEQKIIELIEGRVNSCGASLIPDKECKTPIGQSIYRVVEFNGEFTVQKKIEVSFFSLRKFKFIDEERWIEIDIYGRRIYDIGLGTTNRNLKLPKYKTLAEARAKINEIKRGAVIHNY